MPSRLGDASSKSHLKNITKRFQSTIDFRQTVKTSADELAIPGALFDEDLVEKILNGFGDDYKELVCAVQAHDTSITSNELHIKLLNFEVSV